MWEFRCFYLAARQICERITKSKSRAEHQSSVETYRGKRFSLELTYAPKKVSSKVVKMSRVVLSVWFGLV